MGKLTITQFILRELQQSFPKEFGSLYSDHQLEVEDIFYRANEIEKSTIKHFTLEDMMECWNAALKVKETKVSFGEFIMTKHEQQK